MVKSRQRESKNGIIVHTKTNWPREIIVSIFSIFVWSYCVAVVLFFISAIFDYNDPYLSLMKSAFKMTNTDIRSFMLLAIIIWAIFYCGLWSWKNYNLKRFGSLNRRIQPSYTTTEELLKLELMSTEDFHLLHQSRVVVFEKNPIKEIRK